MVYFVNTHLFGGWRYPAFEQPRPEFKNISFLLIPECLFSVVHRPPMEPGPSVVGAKIVTRSFNLLVDLTCF